MFILVLMVAIFGGIAIGSAAVIKFLAIMVWRRNPIRDENQLLANWYCRLMIGVAIFCFAFSIYNFPYKSLALASFVW